MNARSNKLYRYPANDFRQKLWQAIRIARTFTVAEVAAMAECDYVKARDYIAWLKHSGHLKTINKSKRMLVKNTGPHAPYIRRNVKKIIDTNNNRSYDYGSQS